MSLSNFSSYPPEQEAAFAVYEERIVNTTKSGMMAGLIAGLAVGFVTIVIAFTVTPEAPGDYSADPGPQTQRAPNTVQADTQGSTPPPSEAPPAEPPAEGTAPAGEGTGTAAPAEQPASP